jgi:DNA replication protein DnaC
VNSIGDQPHIHGWVAQAEAKKAALFGLNLRQSGFNLIVLGEHGSGRTSLMQSAMHEVAKESISQSSISS